MARAHFVKAARKDNPVVKKGESYWWWKPMIGGRGGAKRYSKTQPTASQLTNSEFLSAFYSLQESIDAADDVDGLRSCAEELRTLGEEQSEKHGNMPDGLQQGDTGQLLEERAEGCESWADAIEQHCDEYDTKLEERNALRQAWIDFDEQERSNEENDLEDDDLGEPEDERPGEDDTDLLDELRENINNDAPSF